MNRAYNDLKEAVENVDPRKQLKPSKFVTFEGIEKDGLRVMFVGNSITLHGPLAEIGWNNNWGMAASAKENDYVHLCYSHILKTHPDASFCICQASQWERAYKQGEEGLSAFQAARDYGADVIITKLSANSPVEEFDVELYEEQFSKLVDFLNKNKTAKIIVCTEFFEHPAKEAIIAYAKNNKFALCDLSDLGSNKEMKAIGQFEHGGVAAHPGDLGMKTIADRICKVFDQFVL